MSRWFNIGGPCNPATNYMLPAMERLPDVAPLIRKGQYFVVHAQRQCGKTTAFLSLANELNAKGESFAIYCSLETVQEFPKAEDGIPQISSLIIDSVECLPGIGEDGKLIDALRQLPKDGMMSSGVMRVLSLIAKTCGKPLHVFFDEVDCLGGETLITFLRQLRNGKIDMGKGKPFPSSVALIGMRDIRDYKAKMRPDSETFCSASPFNVVTKAMTLRTFTDDEVAALYAQHTAETGQTFESEAVRLACLYSGGQPYLVNALARWCVEEIHHEDFTKPVTAAEMEEAKEKIIRERGTHLDSLMERMKEPRVRRIVEPVLLGDERSFSRNDDGYQYVLDLGLLVEETNGPLRPANPIYAETIGRYLSRDDQDDMKQSVPETPWVKEDGLDMSGLMAAFQDFWRENALVHTAPFGYNESYPHIVLQAFLQRVINGGGQIVREMALGSGRLDLGVLFRGSKYAVEVKLSRNYEKNREKSHEQVCRYMDHLGESEGWLVVFDQDFTKPWEEKISTEDIAQNGKTIHVVRC